MFGLRYIEVAVVVDTFADARQNDVQNLAEEMEDEIECLGPHVKSFALLDLLLQKVDWKDKVLVFEARGVRYDRKALGKLFERIDKDGSGQLTLEETWQNSWNWFLLWAI